MVPPFFPVRSNALKMLVEHEHAGVRHEQLERRQALSNERVHLLLHLIVQLGDDHVKAVVDDGLALGLFHPRLPGVVQRLAAVLNREIDDRCRPAEGRRPRPALEVVSGCCAAKRHVEMRVDVDAARQHVLAGRIDHRVRLHVESRSDDRDLLVLDQDITGIAIGRSDDGAVLDECRHDGEIVD